MWQLTWMWNNGDIEQHVYKSWHDACEMHAHFNFFMVGKHMLYTDLRKV